MFCIFYILVHVALISALDISKKILIFTMDNGYLIPSIAHDFQELSQKQSYLLNSCINQLKFI